MHPPPHTGRKQHSLDELDEFYHKLNKLVGGNKKHNLMYIAGDVNAKVINAKVAGLQMHRMVLQGTEKQHRHSSSRILRD